ncbi:MAG: diguanylate cyclase [Deltaproteobacteria bacterium]|nr:diguanylate cyclase [Deltaproteobacteria bacterium]
MRQESLRRRAPMRNDAPIVELLLLLLVAGGVAMGAADPDRAQLPLPRVIGLALLPALIVARSYANPSQAARRGHRAPMWVPALAVLAAVLVQAGGGPAGPLGVVAFLGIGAGSLNVGAKRVLPWAVVTVLAVAVPVVMGNAVGSLGSLIPWGFGVLLSAAIPGTALVSERHAHRRTQARLRTLEDEAGGLRHESSQVLPTLRDRNLDDETRERDLRSIARQLQQDIERAASMLVTTLGATTASIYRPDGDEFGDRLVLVAAAGDTRSLVDDVGTRDGLFGAAFKAMGPVCLKSPQPDDRRVVHRSTCQNLGSVLALPLLEGERRYGVMVLDAPVDMDLDGQPREFAGHLADFVTRLIARAVDLSAIREGMRENHAFYEACRAVSRHVRIDAIAQEVVHSAGRFVDLDRCALALADDLGATLRVVAHDGFGAPPPHAPFPIRAEEGLLAQAVRHRTAIDRPDLFSTARAPVLFGKAGGPARDLASLLVLPVYAPGGDHEDAPPPLGALLVARESAPDFSAEDNERLEVLLHQAGASISNGRLFAEHESRSITDGMTGLPNHRRFQEVMDEKLARCSRTGSKLSLLLMDIDKFKSVNDTYGHPMGDEVIRRLARVLAEAVRGGQDLAARYGGEEFVVVLEDADAGDALVLADRLRESFKDEQFVHMETDGARPLTFRCSMSVGIACYPDDASAKAELVDKADQALYLSKQRGRDRATCWETLRQANGSRGEARV